MSSKSSTAKNKKPDNVSYVTTDIIAAIDIIDIMTIKKPAGMKTGWLFYVRIILAIA